MKYFIHISGLVPLDALNARANSPAKLPEVAWKTLDRGWKELISAAKQSNRYAKGRAN